MSLNGKSFWEINETFSSFKKGVTKNFPSFIENKKLVGGFPGAFSWMLIERISGKLFV